MARAGFVCTAAFDSQNKEVLLPEIQFEYALLDFKELHVSKKVQSLLDKQSFTLVKNERFEEVIQQINGYHKDSWLLPQYTQILKTLFKTPSRDFELCSFELIEKKSNHLIAGELGYCIGKTYTSLTGFFKKEPQYNNCGKLQLVMLAHYLEQHGFDLWNLGHACMSYKIDLGAKVYQREAFLKRWFKAII